MLYNELKDLEKAISDNILKNLLNNNSMKKKILFAAMAVTLNAGVILNQFF